MPNYDESFVENSLRALQEEQSQTIDENTELVMNRIDEYLAQYQGEDKVVTSHEKTTTTTSNNFSSKAR